MAKKKTAETRKPRAQKLSDACDPVPCGSLLSKLQYSWQILLHYQLITQAEAIRIDQQLTSLAEKEVPFGTSS
jgi:hypothetical protein